MKLTGNAADRWQQVSDKLGELALSISAKQALVEGILSALDELNGELANEKKTLETISSLTLKEVLREESGTLNDEPPEVMLAPTSQEQQQKQVQEQPKEQPKPQKQPQEQAQLQAVKEKVMKVEAKVEPPKPEKPQKTVEKQPKQQTELPITKILPQQSPETQEDKSQKQEG